MVGAFGDEVKRRAYGDSKEKGIATIHWGCFQEKLIPQSGT